jgi:hypothetical protein
MWLVLSGRKSLDMISLVSTSLSQDETAMMDWAQTPKTDSIFVDFYLV